MEDREAEPQQACQLLLLMEVVRELQAPTQKATTTQETHSQETEEEQPQMEVTETAVEPEAERSEEDQMRDTDEVGSETATSAAVDGGDDDMAGEPCWKEMSRRQKKDWKRRGGREGLRPAPSGVDAPF